MLKNICGEICNECVFVIKTHCGELITWKNGIINDKNCK